MAAVLACTIPGQAMICPWNRCCVLLMVLLIVLQTYMVKTQYRLGRGHTGFLTHLTVHNQSFLVAPGAPAGKLGWPAGQLASPRGACLVFFPRACWCLAFL